MKIINAGTYNDEIGVRIGVWFALKEPIFWDGQWRQEVKLSFDLISEFVGLAVLHLAERNLSSKEHLNVAETDADKQYFKNTFQSIPVKGRDVLVPLNATAEYLTALKKLIDGGYDETS